MPPHLMNFQAWLSAQGLTFEAGITPKHNISNIAADAWNDSVTISDDSTTDSVLALLIVDDLAVVQGKPDIQFAANEVLIVTVDVHRQGLSFGLSNQGTNPMNLLLADPIPRQQLNASIYLAMRPLLATMGPWAQGYGMRHDHFRVEFQVSVGDHGL